MARQDFALDYIDVATRIVEFRTRHPEGSLQQVKVDFIDFAGSAWVVYTAAAYRTPTDERPGIGTAWEPVPGKTSFTRDSELQNAETAAWGRAIVAALAGDTKKGVASAEEVRNRQAEQASPQQGAGRRGAATTDIAVARAQMVQTAKELGMGSDPQTIGQDFQKVIGKPVPEASIDEIKVYVEKIREDAAKRNGQAEQVPA